ncbi:uncharacterized protein C05D11.1-like [Mizuhopecten yessoensis]|uniref:Uncharacterized protein C05D11.1 n=1 Tax=Mizuhopecten yessoensis TaxID=6573 RepID=A0A210PTU6_MIZYE|nr:uncharacterized protein C05D11.1-like [Mizuhopecten yessoensis]OWF39921.1 Uncharacterized protein C05D11.1 [Mizuhopecten yessoensis]
MAESRFEFLYDVTADGNIPVSKYRSKNTGISVFIAQVEGPLVNGYFCLATEAHDDDGLPHTLEHLIFLGSEDYPYKGVLDLLANRCLASGTNAWTDTDHTCYTMTNAGSEGFLKLLPYYLDHILYPTLTESGYVTEVHHINGEGEDAGVVYCEMQARENTGESRCQLEMVRAMYPGRCGYKSETGGIMANLRDSTSHKKVCDYHREFYRPENLCLIITGQVSADEVFQALKPVENKIISKGSRSSFIRPWMSEVPPLEKPVVISLPYAADEETHGMVNLAWRGPHVKDQYLMNALHILQEYLSDSAISPLQKELVEVEEPYCSQISASVIENSKTLIYFNFTNVTTSKLTEVKQKVNEVLRKTHQGSLDMARIDSIVHRKILESLRRIEDAPHDTLSFIIIGDFLYSQDKADTDGRVNVVTQYQKMKAEKEDFWKDLLARFFLNEVQVVIEGVPSKTFMEESGQEEKDRVAKQQKHLGEDGLKKLGERLEKATEDNEEEAPEDVLTQVSVPDVSSIHFHHINPSSNLDPKTANANLKFPLDKIPFRFQLDDMKTNFVQINALLDSSSVPRDLRLYLPLMCQVLFESPILRDGELISHEEIVKQLEADMLSYGGGLGVTGGGNFSCGAYPQVVDLQLQLEKDKYEKGIQLMKELLYRSKFTVDRLKIVAQRLASDVASSKRKGIKVVRTMIGDMVYHTDCNVTVTSMLRQEKFLKNTLKQLESDPDKVLRDIEQLRQTITRPSNLRIHLSANVESLIPSPQSPWIQFVPSDITDVPMSGCMKQTYEYNLGYDESPETCVIMGVGSVESSYLIQVVPSISSFMDADLPAVLVFIQYMTQCEGPMWRQIRGLGLSYHYGISVDAEKGLLKFLLARSTNITGAYKEGRNIVMGYVNGETRFSAVELESARSSLIFEIIEEEKTVSGVSELSMLSYFRGTSLSYNKELLSKVAKVTVADLQRVGPKYISPLFDVTRARTAICCHHTKVDEVKTDFSQMGLNLKVLPSLEEDFLCGY